MQRVSYAAEGTGSVPEDPYEQRKCLGRRAPISQVGHVKGVDRIEMVS